MGSHTRPRLLLVSPRPPRQDGQGDQRRAHYALTGLSADWDVDVISWLPNADEPGARRWLFHPLQTLRALALSVTRPASVAYVQSLAPGSLSRRLGACDAVLFVTDRAVPSSVPSRYAIDFIDDLGGAAARRAAMSGPLSSRFWRWESRRLRRYDKRLAEKALLSLAVNHQDAAAIAPSVRVIPPATGTHAHPDTGGKVVFAGNLFYGPNLEAASWICTELAPRLASLGVEPHDIVIAGRRPPAALMSVAAAAGIDLRPDVPDLPEVLAEAAVVITPVVLGSGVQNKVLDAVGTRRACVVSHFTNQALGLVDGHSALVRERTADQFAEAIVSLLADPALRQRLVKHATQQFACYTEEAVTGEWRRHFQALLPARVVRAR